METSRDIPSPRISIVVPAYNRERYLGPTLDSVLTQTFSAWEVVVFDDGSTDGTMGVAERYAAAHPRIRCAGGPNEGVASARTRGFRLTDPRSEFVIFLDSDDLWLPDTLETLVGVLEAHPGYSSSHGTACCVDADGRPIAGDDLEDRARERVGIRGGRLQTLAFDLPTTFAELAWHNWILTPGTHLIRRAVLERVGGFDPATDPADDWDMAVRVSRHGDIGFVDRPVIRWRRHPHTLTMTSPRWKRAYFLAREKMLRDPENTPEQRRVARAAYHLVALDALAEARSCLGRRQFVGALRHGVKALETELRLLRAALPGRRL